MQHPLPKLFPVARADARATRPPVFPCRPDKSPWTAQGFKDASTDADQVRRWWRIRPGALVGVPTGLTFDVLDLDLQHAEAAAWFNSAPALLPLTRVHHTRSGGRHLLFAPTPGLTNSKARFAHGVDVRAKGGYVIWWPAHGFAVEHPAALASMPNWLFDKLKPPPKPGAQSRNWWETYGGERDSENSQRLIDARISGALALVISARDGEQNNKLYWSARRLAEMCSEGLLDEEDARELLLDAARRGNHPYDRAEKTIRSAFNPGRKA